MLGCSVKTLKCGTCAFCLWSKQGAPADEINLPPFGIYETKRLCAVYSTELAKSAKTKLRNGGIRPVAAVVPFNPAKKIRINPADSTGPERLKRFLRLLHHLDKAPWANIRFNVNQKMIRRLTASHLHLIVGKDQFKSAGRSDLYHLIDSELRLDGSQNIVWVTNRQQGKTSTGPFVFA